MSDDNTHYASEYDKNFAAYKSLREEILFIVDEALRDSGIRTHSVTCRVKRRDSFLEKISRKGYADPFVQMLDVVGVRVVCLFMADLPKLEAVLREWFDVGPREDKIDGGPVESFGYMSHHFECRLRQEHSGPRYDRIKHIPFELQTRTLLQDAWANVSHHLAYKGESSVPDELKRDFHALSGLFYVADQHFQLFYAAAEASEQTAAEEVTRPTRDSLPINRPRMRALLRRLYPDRGHVGSATISEFVEEVTAVGYESIGALESRLTAAYEAFCQYEKERPPAARPDDGPAPELYQDVGAARLSLAIADPRYAEDHYDDSERFEQWRQQMASP